MDTRFPGVYTQLIDTSFGIPSSGVSTAFIAFISEKGRDNQLVSIGSVEELLSTFGTIDSGKYGQGMLVLSNWFSAASAAYCVRVMPDMTNVPVMTYQYSGVYGKYSNSTMTMVEAGYANLAIIVNKFGAVELRNIAPKYYGSLKGLNQTIPPTFADANVGDRYAVSYLGQSNASGDWESHEGYIATVRSKTTLNSTINWTYEPMDTIGYCKAYNRNYYLVNYTRTSGTYTSSWEEIEPEFDRFEATTVMDIYSAPPGGPYSVGESYLVSVGATGAFRKTIDGVSTSMYGKVATYNGKDENNQDVWLFTYPDRVIIENDLYVYYNNPSNVELAEVTSDYIKDLCGITDDAPITDKAGILAALKNAHLVDETAQVSDLKYDIGDYDLRTDTQITNEYSVIKAPKATYKKYRFIVGEHPVGTWSTVPAKMVDGEEVSSEVSYIGKIAYPKEVGYLKSPTGYMWQYYMVSTTLVAERIKECIIMARTEVTTSSLSNQYKYFCFATRPNYKVVQYWTRNPDVLFPAYINRTSEMDAILSSSRPDLYSTSSSGEYLFILHAIGRGSYYNNIQVSMSLSTKSMLQEEDYDRTMILDIYDTSSGSKVLLESFEVSLNPEARDSVTDASIYIVNVLENYSKILRCRAVDPAYLTRDFKYMENINTRLDTLFTEYERYNTVGTVKLSPALAGGYDGNLYNGNGTVNWNVAKNLLAKAYTGLLINPNANDESDLYLTDVLDTEMVLIDVVLDAGYPKEVKVAINDMITARSNDCIGIIDQLDNASSEMAYRARTDTNGITKGFNTPYIAIYEPYSEIYDRYTGNNIWVTPIYHAAKAFAITDRDYGRHYAPAGANRGVCTGINKLRYNLYKDSAYKDKFVTYCINPIICNRLGYIIYGQSTSYLKQTKLQDINIVRTIIEIERDLKLQLGTILFDLNDSNTLMTIDSAVRAYLGNKMANDVIDGYDCKVYATDYDITQHRARVDLVITPKSVLYQIFLTISV